MPKESKKIKVAFFADILVKDFDGASRTMYQLIERIPKDKYEFHFFCGMPPNHDTGFPVYSVPSIPIPFNSTYKVAIPLFSRLTLIKKLDEFDADIIHIASPSPLGVFAHKYNKKKKVPVITIYHTHFISYIQYYLRSIPSLINTVRSKVAGSQKKFYKKASLMYVPTQQIIKELDEADFHTENMKIWQRGINHAVFNTNKKDISYIRSITGNEKPNIIFASRLVWEKNLSTLIEVFKLSKANGDLYNFIIVGDGVAKEAAQEQMTGAFFMGKVDHDSLSKLYASSDVFIFPSVSETYGNVVVEAMACGCPCVIARGGGSQSLVKDGERGFLCEPNDAREYLDRINEIISNEPLKSTFVNNGLAYTKELDWDKLADVYFEDIETLYQEKGQSIE